MHGFCWRTKITERQELQLRIEKAEKISAGEQKDGQVIKIDPADLKVRQTEDAKAKELKKTEQERQERERKVEPPPPPPELDPNKSKIGIVECEIRFISNRPTNRPKLRPWFCLQYIK